MLHTVDLSLCFVIKERSRQIWRGRVLELFPTCIDSVARAWRPEDRIEVVVADYGSTDWPLLEWLPERLGGINCKVVAADGDFSRGRGLNLAAGMASLSNLLFLDADMIIPRELLTLATHHARSGRVFVPVYRDLDENGIDCGERTDGYGSVAISRSIFVTTRNWPEFYSWGGEDTVFYEELTKRRSVVRHEVSGFYHQWHPHEFKERFYSRRADSDYNEYRHRQAQAGNS